MSGGAKKAQERLMTVRQVKTSVLLHLFRLTGTLALVAVLAVVMWQVRPHIVIWIASGLIALHLPGLILDAQQCVHYLVFRPGGDR